MPTSELELPVGPSIKATILFPLGRGNQENTSDQDPEHTLGVLKFGMKTDILHSPRSPEQGCLLFQLERGVW